MGLKFYFLLKSYTVLAQKQCKHMIQNFYCILLDTIINTLKNLKMLQFLNKHLTYFILFVFRTFSIVYKQDIFYCNLTKYSIIIFAKFVCTWN